MRTWLLVFTGALALVAQQHKLFVDPKTEEGRLLQQISQPIDDPAKQALMEQFVAQYPKSLALPWVCGQLQSIYLKQHEFDNARAAGNKALTIDPDNLDVHYQSLKAAEGLKDPEAVKLWATRTSALAEKMLAGEHNEALAAHARQIALYTQYALYETALQQTEPQRIIDLTELLETQNPHSQYLPKMYGSYLNALKQTGQGAHALTRAEQLVQADGSNEDVLLFLADSYFQKKTESAKTLQYANALVSLLNRKPKPPALSDEYWKKKKESLWGLAYWVSGITYSNQGYYEQANQALRWALPYLTDQAARAACLFHLGQANYYLGKAAKNKEQLQEAVQFTEQAAVIEGPLQQAATRNLKIYRGAAGH